MLEFSSLIIQSYTKKHRDLPWRKTRDPYLIWLSEILLQQTRVDQGLPYFQKFKEAFPTLKDLADANEREILKLWQGLGYYSRARNLHYTARFIRDNFGGTFPSSYKDIRSLKGVGDYTAAAIASISFGLPYAVVDGNVYRVLSRYFGIDTAIDSTAGKKQFSILAQELLDNKRPALHNQALMEFGATICIPQNPLCPECPLAPTCFALANKAVSALPVKKGKTRTRNRYFEYLVIHDKDNIILRKREEKDIWQNMYDFPLLEFDRLHPEEKVAESEQWNNYFGKKEVKPLKVSETFRHILSHQVIHARFWHLEKPVKINNDAILPVKKSRLSDYPVPRLIDLYIKNHV